MDRFINEIKQRKTEVRMDDFSEEKRQLKESQVTPKPPVAVSGNLVSSSCSVTRPAVIIQKSRKNKRTVYVKKYNCAA